MTYRDGKLTELVILVAGVTIWIVAIGLRRLWRRARRLR